VYNCLNPTILGFLIKNNNEIIKILTLLKAGYFSTNSETVQWTCRINEKIIKELYDSNLNTIVWDW
jgi:hypothetical protein